MSKQKINEDDYIVVSNLAKLRIAERIMREVYSEAGIIEETKAVIDNLGNAICIMEKKLDE